ncbi:hypothetical protein VaNZ11_001717 [Volvox africanus]|uniref:Nudix hydrolase domain-containing protein n=1 Tax=Volvox africanus TaxID=51714 RepID=A0ABQ5RQN5_9CHLO|nr:hypothetical protein VaNZ11_001717 [Volvox africanus]
MCHQSLIEAITVRRPAVDVTVTRAAEAASFGGDCTPFNCPTSVAAGTGAFAAPDGAHPYSCCPQLRPHDVGSECQASLPLPSLQSLPDQWSPGLCPRWRAWKLKSFAAECHGLLFNIISTMEMERNNNNATEGYYQSTSNGGSATREVGDIGGGSQGAAGGSSPGRGSGDSGGGLIETGKGGGIADIISFGGRTNATWPPAEERLAAVVQRLRALPQKLYPPVSPRAAAVLVGLFEDRSGVVRVLLTQRSAQLKSHRGEVCLPGGKRDEDDLDDIKTALREAQEELGLDPACVTVLACLPPVLSKHHLSVTPVIALIPADMVPQPNPHEVAAAFTVPLAVFLGQFIDPRAMEDASQSGGFLRVPTALPPGDSKVTTGRRTRSRIANATASEGPPAVAKHPMVTCCLGAAAAGSNKAAASFGDGLEDVACAESGRSVGEDVKFANVVHNFRDIRWGEHEYRIHSFQYGEYDVWGLTATICIDAARLALGQEPSFPERCPGGHHYSAFFWDGTALRVRPCDQRVEGGGASAVTAKGAGEPEEATA